MMRTLWRVVLVLGLLGGSAHALEDSVWVYRLLNDNPDCPTITRRLGEMKLRPTVIVSIEGGGFVLDRPNGREQLRCLIDALQASGRRAKLLLLQDTYYLSDDLEALRRMRLVASYAREERRVAGVVVDIEPYLDAEWKSGAVTTRRAVAYRFLRLLRQLRQAAKPLPMDAAIPWWLSSAEGVPELRPRHIFHAMSGAYVMLYGLGGRKEDGLTDRIVKRFPQSDPLLKRGRVYLTLATEDEDSPEKLERDLEFLRKTYHGAKGFAGTSVFHAGTNYKGQ
jgi:hypothetical protein